MEDEIIEKHNPIYKIGECVMVFDPDSGYYRNQDIVRIEGISSTKYYYRWWLPMAQKWASSTNSGIGKFTTFESMTFKTNCPK
jgi:hypothetical protein